MIRQNVPKNCSGHRASTAASCDAGNRHSQCVVTRHGQHVLVSRPHWSNGCVGTDKLTQVDGSTVMSCLVCNHQ